MKTSTVIAIIIFIVALVAIWSIQDIIKNRQRAVPGEEFVKILPQEMRAADIHKIEIYQGDAKKDAVVLARTEDGWSVPSRFDSKGNADTIKTLLDDIKTLQGTFRTKKKSLHGEFDITDEKAVHVGLYRQDDKLYQNLLLGKKGEQYAEGFVRLADSEKVYLADKNLRSTLGMYSEGDDPDPKKWLDLKITDEESDRITKVVMDMPGKQVVLEKKEKEKKEAEEEPEEAEEPTETEEKKEYEWVLTKPEIEFELKTSAVDSLVKAISQLKGEDVADPAKMADYGFDAPTYTATVTMEDESTTTILVGKETEEDKKRYAKLKDGNTIYIVPRYSVTGAFKKMRELVDIKIWELEKDDVMSIALEKPEYDILLERKLREGAEGKDATDYEWTLAKPETRFALKDYRITSILSRVTKPTPQDLFLTDDLSDYGLEEPKYKAVVKMKDDSSHVLTFGTEVEDGDDRYVKFEGKDHVYSFTKYNFDDLFQTLPKLLTIEVMKGLRKDDIVSLGYNAGDEDSFTLTQKEGEGAAAKKRWVMQVGDVSADTKQDVVDDVLDALTRIQFEDMVLGKTDADCGLEEPKETLAISTKTTVDRYVLLFGGEVSEEGGNRYFKVKGEPETFVLAKAEFDKIFREQKDFEEKKPPKPEEPEAKPPPEVLKKATTPIEEPPTPRLEEPTRTEEKPGEASPQPPEEAEETAKPEEGVAPPKEEPEKEEAEPGPPAPEAKPEGEETVPVPPEKEAAPPSEGEGEKEEGTKPSTPPGEESVPQPPAPAEGPSVEKPEESVPAPPVPKPPSPKEPIPVPPAPENN